MNRKARRAEKFGHRNMSYADRIRETYYKYCQFSIQDSIDTAAAETREELRASRINHYFLESKNLDHPHLAWRDDAWVGTVSSSDFWESFEWERSMIDSNRQTSPGPTPWRLYVSYNGGLTYKSVYATDRRDDPELQSDVADCEANFLPYYITIDGEWYGEKDLRCMSQHAFFKATLVSDLKVNYSQHVD